VKHSIDSKQSRVNAEAAAAAEEAEKEQQARTMLKSLYDFLIAGDSKQFQRLFQSQRAVVRLSACLSLRS
jgi:hypothetical protein